jgi:hypothetical protein
VAGPKAILDLAVIAGTLVDVLDDEADRRARRAAFENAGQDPDRVGLRALGHEARATRSPALEIVLQIGLAERQVGRATRDDPAQGGAVTLTAARHREKTTESIASHAYRFLKSA